MPKTRIIWLLAGMLVLSAAWAQLDAARPSAERSPRGEVVTTAERAMVARIDALIDARLRSAGFEPATQADELELLRRLYLDLTGVIPTAGQVQEFLADRSAGRIDRQVDALLDHPRMATHLADGLTADLLADAPNPQVIVSTGPGLSRWIRNQIVDGVRYDKLVEELVMARGSTGQQGPVMLYTSLGMQPQKLAAATSRVFMGVQIQCAECHDHPFTDWKQRDFWGLAAMFAGVSQQAVPQPNDPSAVLRGDVAFTPPGTIRIVQNQGATLNLPDGGETVTPHLPDGREPSGDGERRAQLLRWLTGDDNPYFARAAVNRVWHALFGRGLVDPVNDMGPHNGPSHPALLRELADYFVAVDYDVQALVRTIVRTRAYQRTSRTDAAEIPPELFGRMQIKSLSGGQLYDCLLQAVGRPATPQTNQLILLGQQYDPQRQAFVAKFRRAANRLTEYQAGIPQALAMMNGSLTASATSLERSDLLASLDAPYLNDRQRLESLFLSTLSRPPTKAERRQMMKYVKSGDRREQMADILWALLNSSEFVFNH